MQESRSPKSVFVLLAAAAAIHFSYLYAQLPDVVASHFDAHGRPNGWQSKPIFLTFFVGGLVIASIVGFGIPRIIAAMPPQLINLPNKQWLAPERLAETQAFLNTYFAWFGCALFAVIILTFDYAIQSNLHPENRPDISRMWYILASFLIFAVVSAARMFIRFGRPPQDISSLK